MPDFAILDPVIAQFDTRYRPVRVETPGPHAGFSGAIIFQLHTPQGTFCLRGWPPGGPPAERILGLHRLLEHVHRAGISQVAVPVLSIRGETLVEVGGRFWQIEPWLPGEANFHDHPSTSRLRSAARCLAQWHQSASRFEPAPNAARWFAPAASAPSPAVSDRLEMLRGWRAGRFAELQAALSRAPQGELQDALHDEAARAARLFEQVAGEVEKLLLTASRVCYSLQPCLRDVWHDHLLFTGEEITGIIDPSACRADNVALDLARMLGSLVGDDRSAWDAALDEYGRVRPLSIDELGLIPILDASGQLLSVMRWLERIYLDREGVGQRERVRGFVTTMLARLERFRGGTTPEIG